MLSAGQVWVDRMRERRGATLSVILLRMLVGFAFVPAGLKKVLGQPFTDPQNHGPFHEFLHAFHATGGFYRFVGVVQLTAAILLLTQRFTVLGAALMLPIATAIAVFCWSTGAFPTATVVTLIWLGVMALLAWDVDIGARAIRSPPSSTVVHMARWERCGAAMLFVYGSACLIEGGVYRPRGVELGDWRFYVFPVVMLLPLLTLLLDVRERSRARLG